MSGIQAALSAPNQLPPMSQEQHDVLEKNFQLNRNPSDPDIILIAMEVGLSEDNVKRWFQHRLACWRQKQGLPANQTSVRD